MAKIKEPVVLMPLAQHIAQIIGHETLFDHLVIGLEKALEKAERTVSNRHHRSTIAIYSGLPSHHAEGSTARLTYRLHDRSIAGSINCKAWSLKEDNLRINDVPSSIRTASQSFVGKPLQEVLDFEWLKGRIIAEANLPRKNETALVVKYNPDESVPLASLLF